MELHRIRYFLEVIRQKGFSKAANHCNIAQPSLSQQIRKLEEEVGGSLFLRSRDGVKLSELGKAFLPHAQGIMAEVESARQFKERLQKAIQGPVRLGAIPTIAPYLLPKIISAIHTSHPEAPFEIIEDTTAAIIGRLRDGSIDFALLSPPTKIDEDVDYIEVGQDELLLTLPREHPLNESKAIALSQMKDEKLILLKEAHCLSRQSEGFCKAAGLKTEVTIRSSQIDTLLGMVELGMGFTFTPRMAVAFHSHRKVNFHAIKPEPYFREIRLVWLRRHQLSHTHQALLGCLKPLSGSL